MDEDSENHSHFSLQGTPVPGGRLVSKITKIVDGNSYVRELTYDAHNRLIGINRSNAVSVSISYETDSPQNALNTDSAPYTVIVEYQDKSDPSCTYGWRAIYTSDGHAYITSGNMIYNYADGSNSQRLWSGIHDSEGYLTKSTWNDDDFYSATWVNGNMTHLYHGDGEVVTDYQYCDIINNPLCNLDLNHLFTSDWIDPFTGIIALSSKRSANMVTETTETYYYPFSCAFTTTYTYETDSAGFVTKIKQIKRQVDQDGSHQFATSSYYTITYR
jgi:YD repeat-containing protein